MEPRYIKPASRPLAFISDIHGNLEALETVLAELRRRAIVDILVAGDLLLGGKQPLQVWRRLQQLQARCTRGPSDLALATVDPGRLEPHGDEERVAADRFAHTRDELGELVLMQLRKLPETLRLPLVDGSELVMVHGSPSDPYQPIGHELSDDEMKALVGTDPADLVICGATHVPFDRTVDDVRIVNVGSVGDSPSGRLANCTLLYPKVGGASIEQLWLEY